MHGFLAMLESLTLETKIKILAEVRQRTDKNYRIQCEAAYVAKNITETEDLEKELLKA